MADDPTTPDQPDLPVDETGAVLAARVEPVLIEEEMSASYIDYAMSVIVGRALPDVRDGLKPVHRRILHAMDEAGMRPTGPYRKCASAVGDVMKKYHPHGDTAIYDALVRMGQDFSSRYRLIDGHGNFGSIDGDRAAAMRYTESRLSGLAMELLRGIDEDTVDFVDNYDGYEVEPTVLPARFPSLLANGATGIAVGMATNIPPHNLRELIDATIALMDDPTLTATDLMEYVPAPDFPTGGLVLGQQGAFEAYTTGRGTVKIRSVCEIEDDPDRTNCKRIVVTEIPFMVNKATLQEKIARLANERVVEGIHDIRDLSSNRTGIRIVVELKREANAQVVLKQLYKHSQLQDSFSINLLALVDGVPRTLRLDQALRHYIDHQVEVIERRTRHRLQKAEDRAHLLEGLLVAQEHIEDVIALIRASESADAARLQLIERYELSDVQARAILDMPLRRLAALEAQAIRDEYAELQETIADLRDILARPERVRAIIREELLEVREDHGDDRRSMIVPDDGDMTVEDLIPDQNVVITLTREQYLKRTPVDQYRAQGRGGKGVAAGELRDEDVVADLLTCGVKDILLFFTNQGRSYRIKAYQIPERGRAARGVFVANVPGLALEPDEHVAAILKLSSFEGEGRQLVFATRQGVVKRTALADFDSNYSTLIAINLRDGDELVGVRASDGDQTVILVNSHGKAIRFHESDVRSMGRSATGVKGMTLHDGAQVLAMALAPAPAEVPADREPTAEDLGEASFLLTVSSAGLGKRTPIEEYPVQGRGGQGVITHRLGGKAGEALAGALVVPRDSELMLVTDTGSVIRIRSADVSIIGRSTAGVRVMRLDAGMISGIAAVVDEPEEDEDVDAAEADGTDPSSPVGAADDPAGTVPGDEQEGPEGSA